MRAVHVCFSIAKAYISFSVSVQSNGPHCDIFNYPCTLFVFCSHLFSLIRGLCLGFPLIFLLGLPTDCLPSLQSASPHFQLPHPAWGLRGYGKLGVLSREFLSGIPAQTACWLIFAFALAFSQCGFLGPGPPPGHAVNHVLLLLALPSEPWAVWKTISKLISSFKKFSSFFFLIFL